MVILYNSSHFLNRVKCKYRSAGLDQRGDSHTALHVFLARIHENFEQKNAQLRSEFNHRLLFEQKLSVCSSIQTWSQTITFAIITVSTFKCSFYKNMLYIWYYARCFHFHKFREEDKLVNLRISRKILAYSVIIIEIDNSRALDKITNSRKSKHAKITKSTVSHYSTHHWTLGALEQSQWGDCHLRGSSKH